ncbi:G-type lectin S-receptor-like serine/threonine-protein kinase At4g27290 [Lotus japonicus]|uniref:G-type lectin S-receptor-like serine/threonine-protein kinase At4g27290 n=1 Tax=Lotus japonicus TaxID=34305 RepID=UPI0025848B21|nr:G-type lectin S-receptor-like serine/threonine-protein kinase At4g27290 [Lotus japonicus]
MVHNIILVSVFWFLLLLRTSISLETLAVNQSIRDGESLVSASGSLEAGFFSPGNTTTRRYFGVWYRNITPLTVIWVANREKPLQNNHSGVLKLNERGILQLFNGTSNAIWSSNTSSKAGNISNPIAQLLDSANLVVKETEKASFLWQSFDYPCDTLLSGMKLGWNLETGLQRFLSSWKSSDDPAEGDYTINLDLRGYPQILKFKGSDIKVRSGPWNGESISGYQGPTTGTLQTFVFSEKEVSYGYERDADDVSVISIYTLTPSGAGQTLFWTNQSNSWQVYSTGELDECENYAYCGANSVCSIDGNLPTCECLKGFVPKVPEQWNISYWLNGCVPRNESSCENRHTDGFLNYTHMKLPDTSSSWFNKTMSLEECQMKCLRNCTCVAYANLDISNGGSGCLLWFNNLVDVRKFSQRGQDLHVRVPASELDQAAEDGQGNNKKKIVAGVTVVVAFFVLITCVSIFIIKNPGDVRNFYRKIHKNKPSKEDGDLPTFDFSVLAHATEHFSYRNKLGEGGFGPVYKGTLVDGQEVAVKRLSKKSGQGLEEFKNEVSLIAKLQHRNLAKLLGCCVQGEEKMLIYEYMPNRSLDCFVFDENKKISLDWCKRFNIIGGIARGLLYLHQDSRLRIIHRDLKTSNILLDANLDPKISDFGLARIFLGDQVEANTSRVAGTYGYMPPEYAARGHFSAKTDVFSYGVIVLEIISGKKNRDFSDPKHYHNLLGYAWRLWTEERPFELLDEVLGEKFTPFEVKRCIQVGLLCVQHRPEDRPDMSSVVLMLNGEKLLPEPKLPGYYNENDVKAESDSSSANRKLCSTNEISITELDAR